MENRLLHTPEGVRDIYGKEFLKKLYIQDSLHSQIKKYGYMDIQTPSFEFFDVFSKEIGTTPSKELYKFFDKENNTLVLRPDFTPSIARASAKYFMEEKLPMRLCYEGNTFTNSSDLRGKLKEVTQIGAECIGDDSVEVDAEMISIVIESLLSVGLKDFQVSIGQVEFFKGICEAAGIDETVELELREQISNKNYFGTEEILTGLHVSEEIKERITKVADLFGTVEILDEAKKMSLNDRSKDAIKRLEDLYAVLKLYGIEQYVTFDLGMLNKYHYYTGIVFRAYTFGVGEAIVKGGRYDGLLSRFGKNCAAIGFGIVVDQLMSAIVRQKIELPIDHKNTLIVYAEDSLAHAIAFAKKLREEGRNVELLKQQGNDKKSTYISMSKSDLIDNVYLAEKDDIKEMSE
ncbi:MAG: ATP phosphoribosyltransferase regulatory subunit [Lachnospiraceae bacterium]|nr:ATP phosphoribosyltransferase regulatory subunit [Lachnospiraceae bacterium]